MESGEKEASVMEGINIGKVVCVEAYDKKKVRDNWLPCLVVAPTLQSSVRANVLEDYLVRSFKDGKYYGVQKKDITEFTKEIGARVENPTLKTAVEKALLFLDKDELPPHWDRNLLFGVGEMCIPTDNVAIDSDNSDKESMEEKDHFVAQLFKFMDDRGTPLNQAPVINEKDVDLYKLFKVVNNYGGCNKVNSGELWKLVANKAGYEPQSYLSLQQCYTRYLHSFEDFYRKLGCTMWSHPRVVKSSRKFSRSIIRNVDKAFPSTSSATDKYKSAKNELKDKKNKNSAVNKKKAKSLKTEEKLLKNNEDISKKVDTKKEDIANSMSPNKQSVKWDPEIRDLKDPVRNSKTKKEIKEILKKEMDYDAVDEDQIIGDKKVEKKIYKRNLYKKSVLKTNVKKKKLIKEKVETFFEDMSFKKLNRGISYTHASNKEKPDEEVPKLTLSKTKENLRTKSRRVLSDLSDSASVVQLTQPELIVERQIKIKKDNGYENKQTIRKKKHNKEDKVSTNDITPTPVSIENVPFDKDSPMVVEDSLEVYYGDKQATTYDAKLTRSKTKENLHTKSRRVPSDLSDSASVVQLTQPGLIVEKQIKIKKENGSKNKRTVRKKNHNKKDKVSTNDITPTPVSIENVPFDKDSLVVVGDSLEVYYGDKQATTYDAKLTRLKTKENVHTKSRRVLSDLSDSASVVQLTQPGLIVEKQIKIKKENGSKNKRTVRKKNHNKKDKVSTNDITPTPVSIENVPFDKDSPVVVGDSLVVYYGDKQATTYDAKVINVCDIEGVMKYYVHYKGWNSRYDEWIDCMRIAYKKKEQESEEDTDAVSSKSSTPEQKNVVQKKVPTITNRIRRSANPLTSNSNIKKSSFSSTRPTRTCTLTAGPLFNIDNSDSEEEYTLIVEPPKQYSKKKVIKSEPNIIITTEPLDTNNQKKTLYPKTYPSKKVLMQRSELRKPKSCVLNVYSNKSERNDLEHTSESNITGTNFDDIIQNTESFMLDQQIKIDVSKTNEPVTDYAYKFKEYESGNFYLIPSVIEEKRIRYNSPKFCNLEKPDEYPRVIDPSSQEQVIEQNVSTVSFMTNSTSIYLFDNNVEIKVNENLNITNEVENPIIRNQSDNESNESQNLMISDVTVDTQNIEIGPHFQDEVNVSDVTYEVLDLSMNPPKSPHTNIFSISQHNKLNSMIIEENNYESNLVIAENYQIETDNQMNFDHVISQDQNFSNGQVDESIEADYQSNVKDKYEKENSSNNRNIDAHIYNTTSLFSPIPSCYSENVYGNDIPSTSENSFYKYSLPGTSNSFYDSGSEIKSVPFNEETISGSPVDTSEEQYDQHFSNGQVDESIEAEYPSNVKDKYEKENSSNNRNIDAHICNTTSLFSPIPSCYSENVYGNDIPSTSENSFYKYSLPGTSNSFYDSGSEIKSVPFNEETISGSPADTSEEQYDQNFSNGQVDESIEAEYQSNVKDKYEKENSSNNRNIDAHICNTTSLLSPIPSCYSENVYGNDIPSTSENSFYKYSLPGTSNSFYDSGSEIKSVPFNEETISGSPADTSEEQYDQNFSNGQVDESIEAEYQSNVKDKYEKENSSNNHIIIDSHTSNRSNLFSPIPSCCSENVYDNDIPSTSNSYYDSESDIQSVPLNEETFSGSPSDTSEEQYDQGERKKNLQVTEPFERNPETIVEEIVKQPVKLRSKRRITSHEKPSKRCKLSTTSVPIPSDTPNMDSLERETLTLNEINKLTKKHAKAIAELENINNINNEIANDTASDATATNIDKNILTLDASLSK